MRRLNTILFIAVLAWVWSCGSKSGESSGNANNGSSFKELAESNFMPLESNTKGLNRDDPKVVLGEKVFFEKGLSKDKSTSCNSCHDMANFGVDNVQFSKGAEGKLTKRNSPTVFHVGSQVAQFWDGRAKTLRDQIRMPIMTDGEMSMESEQEIIDRLNAIQGYQEMFQKAYPNADEITIENMSDAVANYIETFSFPSKLDKYLTGNEDVLSKTELKGMKLFIEVGCTDCHQGRLLGGDGFEKFGVHDAYWKHTGTTKIDSGRFEVSHMDKDMFVFKVPSLRNVAKTYPYFHDGTVSNLERAIQIMGKVQLNRDISSDDASSIAAFLRTLTSEVPKDQKLSAGI